MITLEREYFAVVNSKMKIPVPIPICGLTPSPVPALRKDIQSHGEYSDLYWSRFYTWLLTRSVSMIALCISVERNIDRKNGRVEYEMLRCINIQGYPIVIWIWNQVARAHADSSNLIRGTNISVASRSSGHERIENSIVLSRKHWKSSTISCIGRWAWAREGPRLLSVKSVPEVTEPTLHLAPSQRFPDWVRAAAGICDCHQLTWFGTRLRTNKDLFDNCLLPRNKMFNFLHLNVGFRGLQNWQLAARNK